jgi:hypothetical protein
MKKEPVQQPMGTAIEWLIDRADFSQAEDIKRFVKREDWAGLKAWVKRNAAPPVWEEFKAEAWPPPPRMYNGLPPGVPDPFKNTFAAIQSGGRWVSLEQAAAEEAERERRRQIELEYPIFEEKEEW